MTEQTKTWTVEECITLCELMETKVLPELKALVDKLDEAIPCKQVQLISMDTESMINHLNDLKVNGPKPKFIDIPLEQSETTDPNQIDFNLEAKEPQRLEHD